MTRRFQAAALLLLTVVPTLLLAQGAVAPRMITPFASGGSSAITAGTTTITGGTDTRVIFNDAGVWGEDAGFTYVKGTDKATLLGGLTIGSVTTAGRATSIFQDTITGASATSNFLNVTGTFPGTLSAETSAALFAITADNDAFTQNALKITMAGAPSSAAAYGVHVDNASTGTYSIGVRGFASGAAAVSTGVIGIASAGTDRIGGFFSLANENPPFTDAALVINNGAVAANIFEARDNGTAVVTIADGGVTTFASGVSMSTHLQGTAFFGAAADSKGLWFGTIANSNGMILNATEQTPDAMFMGAGTTSNSWHFAETQDRLFDFNNGACGTAACTDPGFIISSAVQDTTQYNHLAAWGQAGGAIKTLTDGVATSIVRIPVANNSYAAGEVIYEIYATDGTDMQVRSSRIRYAMTNKAGTEACNIAAMDGTAATNQTDDDNVSSITAGTLTYDVTCTNVAADTMDIQFRAVSSLTETTLRAKYSVKHLSSGAPARQ